MMYSSDGKHVLVHGDGGACHGTPLEGWTCPKCGISPDMQSTEFWRVDLVRPPVPPRSDPLVDGALRTKSTP